MSSSRRSRLRLVVIQALVFSLFATLFVRLYYLQVVSGKVYQGRAAAQSVREIVVQPARGLIVDDQGRPLVANRLSWVVSVDRTVLGKLSEQQGRTLVKRVARVVDQRPARMRKKLVTCGSDGSAPGVCWNGSPYQPVPVALDVDQARAQRILEQPEDFPGVVVRQQTVRAYPSRSASTLPSARLPEPDHRGRARPGRVRRRPFGQRSVGGRPRRHRAGVRRVAARHAGYEKVAVDSMGRVLGDDSQIEAQPGDTLVTSLDAKVQATVEQQLAETIATARATRDTVTGRNYVADFGAVVVMETDTGRIVAMASQPTYDPEVWVGGITKKQLAGLY